MIETIYNSVNKEDMTVRLPKNIQQIGSGEEKYHIYIEEKVWTYLQLVPENRKNIRYGVLIGGVKFSKGETYVFIRGCIDVRDVLDNLLLFGDDVWSGIYEDMKKYFQGEKIVGWYSSVPEFKERDFFQIRKLHLDHFAGNDKVYLHIEREEEEGDFYVYGDGEMERVGCYHIYTEKNQLFERYVFEMHYHFTEKKKPVKMESRELTMRAEKEAKTEERTDGGLPGEKRMEKNVGQSVIEVEKNRKKAWTGRAVSYAMTGALVFAAGMMYRTGQFEPLSQEIQEAVAGIVKQGEGTEDVFLTKEEKCAPQSQKKETEVTIEETRDVSKETSTEMLSEASTENMSETSTEGASETITEATTEEVQSQAAAQTGGQTISIESVEPREYKVQQGDTLYGICKKIYGSAEKVNALIELNHLDETGKIVDGMTLKLP